MEGFDISNSIV